MSDVKPAEADGGGGGGGESTTQGVTSVLDDLGADSPSVQTGEHTYTLYSTVQDITSIVIQ